MEISSTVHVRAMVGPYFRTSAALLPYSTSLVKDMYNDYNGTSGSTEVRKYESTSYESTSVHTRAQYMYTYFRKYNYVYVYVYVYSTLLFSQLNLRTKIRPRSSD